VHQANDIISENYLTQLKCVQDTFATRSSIDTATKGEITQGLMSLHAFGEQLRFVKGGEANLPPAFWGQNGDDVGKVKRTLTHLLHGGSEFVEQLHDALYDPARKLSLFGLACALELFGTVKPDEFPPVNGRITKALRYFGFDVRSTSG
jgi:hypothetical protein